MPCLPTAVFCAALRDLSSCYNLCRLLLLLQTIQRVYFSTVVHFSFTPTWNISWCRSTILETFLERDIFNNPFESEYLMAALGHYKRCTHIWTLACLSDEASGWGTIGHFWTCWWKCLRAYLDMSTTCPEHFCDISNCIEHLCFQTWYRSSESYCGFFVNTSYIKYFDGCIL